MNLLFALGPMEIILIVFIMLIFFLLPLIALISLLTGKYEPMDKLIWVIVIIFLPIVGSILYLIIGTRNRLQT